MNERTQYTLIVAVILVLSAGVIFFQPRLTKAPTTHTNSTTTNTNTPTSNTNSGSTGTTTASTTRFFTDDLPDADPYYRFSALVPSAWVGIYNDTDRSIEFFDPKASAGTNHAISILAQYYTGTDFAKAPSGVQATTMTLDKEPAKSYTLKTDAAIVERVPAWKVGQTYRRVDVLAQHAPTNTYYIFSKGPDVSDAVFTTFLNSLDVQDIIQPQ